MGLTKLTKTGGSTDPLEAKLKTPEGAMHVDGIARGNSGSSYYLSGCAVRRDTAQGPDWSAVSDSAHIPVNLTGVTGGVDVNVKYMGDKIGSLVAGPDERFAMDGACVGASVGASAANVSIGAPCSFYINFDNNNEIVFDSKFFDISRFSVSIGASGLITISHPQRRLIQLPMCQHTSGGSQFEPLTPHYMNTNGAGITSLYLVGEAEGLISYNGTSWVNSSSAWGSADMSYSWDAATGVLTVTHPTVLGSPSCQVTPWDNGGDVVTFVSQVSQTGFKVKFRKIDGTIPALSTALGFIFTRGVSTIRKVPTGRLHVFLGHVQVNCNHVDYQFGNFWFLALMQRV